MTAAVSAIAAVLTGQDSPGPEVPVADLRQVSAYSLVCRGEYG
jgi:hypothetical protein